MDSDELKRWLLEFATVYERGGYPLHAEQQILAEFDRLWGMETLCANALKENEASMWLYHKELEALRKQADEIADLKQENERLGRFSNTLARAYSGQIDENIELKKALKSKAEVLERICEPWARWDSRTRRTETAGARCNEVHDILIRVCNYLDSQEKDSQQKPFSGGVDCHACKPKDEEVLRGIPSEAEIEDFLYKAMVWRTMACDLHAFLEHFQLKERE